MGCAGIGAGTGFGGVRAGGVRTGVGVSSNKPAWACEHPTNPSPIDIAAIDSIRGAMPEPLQTSNIICSARKHIRRIARA